MNISNNPSLKTKSKPNVRTIKAGSLQILLSVFVVERSRSWIRKLKRYRSPFFCYHGDKIFKVHVGCCTSAFVEKSVGHWPGYYMYYRKRGSASYIVREVLSVREREREIQRERERERERERRKWRHHCRAKIGDEHTFTCQNSHNWRWAYTFPCQKFALFVSPFTLPVSPFMDSPSTPSHIPVSVLSSLPRCFCLQLFY